MGSSFYGGNKNSFYGGSGFYGGGGEVEPELTVIDKVPYNFRKTGGDIDVKKKAIKETVIGGTIAWNQQIQNGNFASTSGWSIPTADTLTVEGNKATISGPHTTYTRIQRSRYSKAYANHKYLIMLKVSSSSGKVTLIPNGSTSGGMFAFTGLTEETQIAKIWAPAEDYATVSWHVRFNVTTPDVSEQITATVRDYCAFDLTQMFGSTIADYIYSLEQETAGAGVAWFRKLFPKEYYAYNAGSLQSVQTSAHKMVGFNAYDNATGTARLLGGMEYQITGTYTALAYSTGETIILDANGKFTPSANGTLTVTGGDSTTMCVHLVWDGKKDGIYEPYVECNYPLDSNLELRGILELDENNKLRFNGDTYKSDGTVTRRYGIVDLGTLTWRYSSNTMRMYTSNMQNVIKKPTTSTVKASMICSIYVIDTDAHTASNLKNKTISASAAGIVSVYDTDYTDTASFKSAMSGVYLVYELATPTTETAEAYTNPQIIDPYGTEEYVDVGVEAGTRDVAIPVGHETIYKI